MLSRIFRGKGSEERGGALRVLWETFIRDNRIVPPVLAIVALLIFSWVVAGSFVGGRDEPVSSSQSVSPGGGGEVAQSDGGSAQATPEIENPNAESFAAYESKDPFRNLFTPANADTGETVEDGNTDTGIDDDQSGNNSGSGNNDAQRTDPTEDPASNQYNNGQQNNGGNGGGNNNNSGGGNGGGGNNGGASGGGDSDGDGVSDDLDDDSGNGSGNGNSGNGNSGDGNLFDSGGTLPNPGR